MKAFNSPLREARRIGRIVLLPLIASFVAGEAVKAPPTHTLFMGADIELQQGKDFYRVEDVASDSFLIHVQGKEVKIPTRFNKVGMKVGHELKVTDVSATVEKLVVERGYTSANDPNAKFARELSASAADAQLSLDQQSMAVTATALQQERVRAAEGNSYNLGRYAVDYEQQAADAQQKFTASEKMMSSDLNSAGAGAQRLASDLAEENFDAIEIEFQISAKRPLLHPYLVVLAQFSERGAKPNEIQSWVYAAEMDKVTSDVHSVKIRRGGFAPGFKLNSYQIHIYNGGQEVATNVADKAVPLTLDEAFQFLLIDYLHTGKGKTLPATLALGHLPASVRNTLPARTLFISVTKNGVPVAAFPDEACSHKIEDPALEMALQNLRFKPALEKGKAVQSVARLAF